MFVNTTPHSINLRFKNGNIVTVEPSEDEKLRTLFRCDATSEDLPPLVLENGDTISITGPPSYSMSMSLFDEVFGGNDKEVETIYLMSTISAMVWKNLDIAVPKNCRFVVPYSGPITSKCLRNGNSFVWVAELIDYS